MRVQRLREAHHRQRQASRRRPLTCRLDDSQPLQAPTRLDAATARPWRRPGCHRQLVARPHRCRDRAAEGLRIAPPPPTIGAGQLARRHRRQDDGVGAGVAEKTTRSLADRLAFAVSAVPDIRREKNNCLSRPFLFSAYNRANQPYYFI